jgi:hypothetical protein
MSATLPEMWRMRLDVELGELLDRFKAMAGEFNTQSGTDLMHALA